jgi:5-methylcytosine-specific restriction endonuclease McrA
MCLVLTAKAEVVAEYNQSVRSVSRTFQMPSVVRLKKYVRAFKRSMSARCTRRNILVRDRFTCQYCGEKCSMNSITVDHVIPKSRGGATVWNNVVAACHPCNRRKADKTLHEANLILATVPRKPSWADLVEESNRELIDSWRPFLLTMVAG